jgi:hypothetical protein
LCWSNPFQNFRFCKEKKIIYGVFAGIIASIILFIYSPGTINFNNYKKIYSMHLITILPAAIGGYLGTKY